MHIIHTPYVYIIYILDLEVIFIIQNFNYVCAHTYMFSCAGTHNYCKSVYTCVQADEAVHAAVYVCM